VYGGCDSLSNIPHVIPAQVKQMLSAKERLRQARSTFWGNVLCLASAITAIRQQEEKLNGPLKSFGQLLSQHAFRKTELRIFYTFSSQKRHKLIEPSVDYLALTFPTLSTRKTL
jgi:hypothetical protein